MTRMAILLGVCGVAVVLEGAAVHATPRRIELAQFQAPSTVVANHIVAQGIVDKVDHAKRTMTLKLPSGDRVALKVGPEVRGFEQIQNGDPVMVEYVEAVSLSLRQTAPGQGGTPDVSSARYHIAVPGSAPSTLVNIKEMAATVESVDPEKRMVTLRAAEGEIVTLHISPEAGALDRIKPGDQVIARYAQALAIEVRKAR